MKKNRSPSDSIGHWGISRMRHENNTDKSESTHSSTHTSTTISSESSSSSSEAASSSAAQTSSKTVTQAGTLDQLSAAFPQDRLPSEVPVTEQRP